MDKGSIVPNLFFDLIGRVVPGATLMLVIYVGTGRAVGMSIGRLFIPTSLASASTPWLVIFLGSAYLFGHLLSPVVECLKWIGERESLAEWKLFEKRENSEHYNSVRYRKPSVAVFATRIRSEAIMYGATAGAILCGTVAHLAIRGGPLPGGITAEALFYAGSFGLFVLLAWRYYSVQQRFCKTVEGLWSEQDAQKRAYSQV